MEDQNLATPLAHPWIALCPACLLRVIPAEGSIGDGAERSSLDWESGLEAGKERP